MKKNNFLAIVLSSILVGVSFVSCGKDDETGNKKKEPQVVNGEVKTCTVNGVSFNMVSVLGGTSQMGSPSVMDADASPAHDVKLSNFAIGQTEVTQELWEAVMGDNPSHFNGKKLPVEQVDWNDCQTFIQKLNQLTGMQFRLPTEAEWEFAARGGTLSQGYAYSGSNNVGDVAWCQENSEGTTHEVGTKAPNELKLYDMSGNVNEWCQDWYDYYQATYDTPIENPQGPSHGVGGWRVMRGGWWYYSSCSVIARGTGAPTDKDSNIGFRLALSLYADQGTVL